MSQHPAPHPATANSRYLAFFDECGDHSLTKIDADFPLFVLALVVMERAAYRDTILPAVNQFKLRYWNHEGINLHSRDIRLAQGPFHILLHPQVRLEFMKELSALMARLPFTLFIAAIHKQRHFDHSAAAEDPYGLALKFTLERLVHFLTVQGETQLPLVAEARGKQEDNALRQVFAGMLTEGTEDCPAEQFKQLDYTLSFQPKHNNIVGNQLADLCAYPCARHILNPAKVNEPHAIASRKIYENGGVRGWKVFP